MFSVERASLEHLRRLDVQPRHAAAKEAVLRTGLPPGDAYAVLQGERVVAVLGVSGEWAWAFLASDLRRGEMVFLHRQVADYIRAHPILAEIDESHPAAVRWARMLGLHRVDADGAVYYCSV
jgi:hypothetical protein